MLFHAFLPSACHVFSARNSPVTLCTHRIASCRLSPLLPSPLCSCAGPPAFLHHKWGKCGEVSLALHPNWDHLPLNSLWLALIFSPLSLPTLLGNWLVCSCSPSRDFSISRSCSISETTELAGFNHVSATPCWYALCLSAVVPEHVWSIKVKLYIIPFTGDRAIQPGPIYPTHLFKSPTIKPVHSEW